MEYRRGKNGLLLALVSNQAGIMRTSGTDGGVKKGWIGL